uniref:THAP-type domain-containing protein n=1 Tax=Daphnia galeata TaxID=27404 RepID=A0A8J2WKY9_9CRUS|nr:unnamed protein product [Daphnia galeata]
MSVIEMPSCCVAYCQSDSRCNDNLISLFGVPKDQALFEEWAKVIPIKRKPLNPKSLVCQLHFEETCIKNSNKKKNRRLKTGSIPTLRFTRESNQPQKNIENQVSMPVVFSVPGGLIVLKQKNTNNATGENELLNLDQLNLPGHSWRSVKLVNEQQHPVIICYETVLINLDPVIRKTALINLQTKEIEYKVFQRKCPPLNTSFLRLSFSSIPQLEISLQYFDCVRTCPGINEEKFHELKEFIFPCAYFEKGVWRSDDCLQLVTEVKQKRKDDLLCSCCLKCNTLLVKTLKPHLEKTNEILTRSLKTQYMTRDALLAKLTEIREENQNLELAMKRQKEPLMVMADVLEVEMLESTDNDEEVEVMEERPARNKKRKYSRNHSK